MVINTIIKILPGRLNGKDILDGDIMNEGDQCSHIGWRVPEFKIHGQMEYRCAEAQMYSNTRVTLLQAAVTKHRII